MLLFSLVTIGSLALSLLAKYLADSFLTDRVPIIGSFAGLQLSHNPGVAFGVRLGGWEPVIIPLALLLVATVAIRSAKTSLSRIGYGMIVGGALGNVLDRVRDGAVTDFFQVGTFPIFNVADSFITVGVVFLLLEMTMQYWSSRTKIEG